MLEVPSLPHLLMVLVIFALLFGAKKVPEIAGSMGKGIKEFRRNIRDDAREDTRDLSADARSADAPSRSTSLSTNAITEPDTLREPRRLVI